MFTGLIEHVGEISEILKGDTYSVLAIKAPALINEITVGDSVAVNGTCLTATSIQGDTFTADVMVQTLNLTSLGSLNVGSKVNLELAAQLNKRFGGHIVQGHIDDVAVVVSRTPGENWEEFIIKVPQPLTRYIVNQGSIAVDGVSLTVGLMNDEKQMVTLWLIPETLRATNLSERKPGDFVNIEVDILAKYIERLTLFNATKGEHDVN